MNEQALKTSELEQVIERAHDEMDEQEFEHALHDAEDAGARAGQLLAALAVVAMLLGGVIATAVLGQVLWLLILPLLFVFYALPLIAASEVAAEHDAERDALVHSLEARELRAGLGKKRLA